ncbi:hypothetical protein BH10ACT1_BH10ACT1_32630 [soil metagenome]
MPFAVKADVGGDRGARSLSFDEKTMYRGWEVRSGDDIYVFDSENQGGSGLCARGVVTSYEKGAATRVLIEVRPTATARRPLGRAELAPFRELDDGAPASEITRKLYRQPTNKVIRISDEEAAFLATHF